MLDASNRGQYPFLLFNLKVYSDLEVAFVISEDAAIYEALSKTVELLEGHTALFSQHYYGRLFHELLAFQITDRHPLLEVSLSISAFDQFILLLYLYTIN